MSGFGLVTALVLALFYLALAKEIAHVSCIWLLLINYSCCYTVKSGLDSVTNVIVDQLYNYGFDSFTALVVAKCYMA